MPNYTTSYPGRKRPHRRRDQAAYLPNARRNRPHRRGASYVHRSQGMSRRGGRGSVGSGGNDRRPYALVIVGCAFLLFVASIIWYANRSVEITLNGEKTSVRIGSGVERIIEDKQLDLKAGSLLAVDDSVLEREGGEPYTVTLNGKKVSGDEVSGIEIEGGEKLEIHDGGDVYEKHTVDATAIEPELVVDGSGAIGYVSQWGRAGRSEVWHGEVSGKTVDKGVVKEPVDAKVSYASVFPQDRKHKYIALTFDEGPSAGTDEILSVLEEKDVPATFFLSGEAAEADPASARAIADAGHEIAANSYTEAALAELSGDDLRSELSRGIDAIADATSTTPELIRPSFGQFTQQNWAEAMDLASVVVSWNIDSGDWLLKGAQSVADTVVGSAKSGSIVLLTDNDQTSAQTAEALPQIIDRLREAGFTFVTVSDLIATDEDLSKDIETAFERPEDATLPKVPEKDAAADE